MGIFLWQRKDMKKRNASVEHTLPIQVEVQQNAASSEFNSLFLRAIFALSCLGVMLVFVPAVGRVAYFTTGVIFLTIGVLLRILQIRYPGRFTFIGIRERALFFYESLERHQQLYINVLLWAVFLGYGYALDERKFFPAMAMLFVLYCLGVAAYDVTRIYRSLAETTLGKGLIAIGFAVGSNLAISLSGWVIGEITHVAPSTFPHTLSFLAIGSIPFLFLIVGAAYLPIAMLIVPIVWMASMLEESAPRLMKWLFARNFEKPSRVHVIPTLLFQLLFYSFVIALLPKFFSYVVNKFGKDIESTVTSSIYVFDMHPGTECKNADGYRVAYIGDENYILAKREAGQVRFEKPRKCALKETEN